MDRGAWRETDHGVKSWPGLSSSAHHRLTVCALSVRSVLVQ